MVFEEAGCLKQSWHGPGEDESLARSLVAQSTKGYGLASICERLGYKFAHHNALEDAKTEGYVLTKAIEETGIDLEGWFKRIRQPIDPTHSSSGSATNREGNPDGRLFGEVVVFTGALTIVRREAVDLAASAGCEVVSGVNKKATLLVVGDQDVIKLAGHKKSAKHRKAETLIEKGQSIRMLRETVFRTLVAVDAWTVFERFAHSTKTGSRLIPDERQVNHGWTDHSCRWQ